MSKGDATGEARRAEESSGMEENGNIQKQVKRSDNVQNLEFREVMKPTVKEENLGNMKENLMENDIGRKLEITRMRKPCRK